jgi:3-phenylpropionate/trans-cinnamate dioxygenase ferredoxin reductase component
MHQHKYLIVGGGMTADAALRGIREIDRYGSIALVSADQHRPYKRPPLSKGLWKGKAESEIWCHTDDVEATLATGRGIVRLNPAEKQVIDDHGDVYSYEKLLLATGGTPRRLPFDDLNKVIYYRTLDDYRELRNECEQGDDFAVIGSGFIGSEIAAALATNGKKVTLITPHSGIGGRMFPADLVAFLNGYYRARGVEIICGERATGIERASGAVVVLTDKGRRVTTQTVVAGIGIQPNVELASAAGLTLDNGIRVDSSLRTSIPDIFAAGDVASFFNPALGKVIRVEHEDNAYTMGRMAGQSMAGKAISYDHLPFFYSDLFDLGYEAVGELDVRLDTVSDWEEPFRKGIVYYLHAGRVRGVLLWNVWDQLEFARDMISHPHQVTEGDLMGRLQREHAEGGIGAGQL